MVQQLDWSKLIPLTYKEIQKITASSGVYRLSYTPDNGDNYYVFYVGKADNLKDRLLQHIGNLEDNTCIKDYIRKYSCSFKIAEISDAKIMANIERQLFSKFTPRCNFKEPEGEIIEINFD